MGRWLQVASLSLVLRAPIVIIAPLAYSMASSGDISEQWIGFATGMAVACFAIGALITSWLGKRLGEQSLIRLCLLTTAAGILLRSLGGVPAFVSGSLVIGIAIGVLNVVMPGYAARGPKANTPAGSAVAFGLNVGAILAALAVAVFAPIIESWQIIALLPLVLIIAAFLLPDVRRATAQVVAQPLTTLSLQHLRGIKTITLVALFMGVQASGYFVFLMWGPYALAAHGINEQVTSVVVVANQLGQVVSAMTLGVISRINARRSAELAVICIIAGGGGSLILLGLQPWAVLLSGLLLGFGHGAALTTALQMIPQLSSDKQVTGQLSVVAHLVGYLIAGFAPVAVGWFVGSSNFLTIVVLVNVSIATLLLILIRVLKHQPLVRSA